MADRGDTPVHVARRVIKEQQQEPRGPQPKAAGLEIAEYRELIADVVVFELGLAVQVLVAGMWREPWVDFSRRRSWKARTGEATIRKGASASSATGTPIA